MARRAEFASRKRKMMVDGVEEEAGSPATLPWRKSKPCAPSSRAPTATRRLTGSFRFRLLTKSSPCARKIQRNQPPDWRLPGNQAPDLSPATGPEPGKTAGGAAGQISAEQSKSPGVHPVFEAANLKQLRKLTSNKLVYLLDAEMCARMAWSSARCRMTMCSAATSAAMAICSARPTSSR